eukprot:1149425-Pelagomonas_calceolata.AAC.1
MIPPLFYASVKAVPCNLKLYTFDHSKSAHYFCTHSGCPVPTENDWSSKSSSSFCSLSSPSLVPASKCSSGPASPEPGPQRPTPSSMLPCPW